VSGRLGVLYRLDPEFEEVSDPIELGQRSIRFEGAGVDVGEGSVWAAYGDSTLARVDPATLDGDAAPSTIVGPSSLVVAYGSVWVASGAAKVHQFSPDTYDLGNVDFFTVGRAPSGIAAGAGAIWVACRDDDFVERIAADLGSESSRQIPVGDGPTSVAFGAGAVWVANTNARTVSRIDAESYEVETIDVGNPPAGIVVSGGRVWVSVQAP
jgi:streptogramin lyase